MLKSRVICHFDETFMIFFVSGGEEIPRKTICNTKSLEKVYSLESHNAIDEEQYCAEQVQHERAMYISNCANVVLLAFKVFYFPLSGFVN